VFCYADCERAGDDDRQKTQKTHVDERLKHMRIKGMRVAVFLAPLRFCLLLLVGRARRVSPPTRPFCKNDDAEVAPRDIETE
jgi:hypothetical protein